MDPVIIIRMYNVIFYNDITM